MNRLIFLICCLLSLITSPWAHADVPSVAPEEMQIFVCDAAAKVAVAQQECQQLNHIAEIDPRHRHIWVVGIFGIEDLSPWQVGGHGLTLFGKFSARATLNGVSLGGKGAPAATREGETISPMDVILPLPETSLREGENRLVLEMSGHHGMIDLRRPVHYIGIGPNGSPQAFILHAYAMSIMTIGIFGIGFMYFGVAALMSSDVTQRVENSFLALLSFAALGQVVVETLRGLWAYPYPFHDIRLVLITVFGQIFAICLTAYVMYRYDRRRLWQGMSILALLFLASWAVPNFDGKAAFVMLSGSVLSLVITIYWSVKRAKQAMAFSVALFLFSLMILIWPGQFLDVYFFLAMTALLIFLFVQQAMAYAREQALRIEEERRSARLSLALQQAKEKDRDVTVSVKRNGTTEFLSCRRIAHARGAGDYVELILDDGQEILHTARMGDLEEQLPSTFIRVHRSHIVNTAFVKSLSRDGNGGGTLHLTTGADVPVSRRILPQVREVLQ